MNHCFCLPIQTSHAADVLRLTDQNSSRYRYFEVWWGAIQDLDDRLLQRLLSLCAPSLVIVLRTKGLEITLPLERRKFFIREMAEHGSLPGQSALLDLDITTQRAEIAYLKEGALNVKTILSYHNYEETPSLRKLRSVGRWMADHGASVIKVATACQTADDALRLLQFGLELKSQGREYIVLGMGAHGVITRIFGTAWGNKMIFAPRDPAQASAPGQLTLEQLEQTFKILSLK